MPPTGPPPAQHPAPLPEQQPLDKCGDVPSHDAPRPASRFTYRNLADLAAASPNSPLRVIAHIDLDAYYAQCEMLRLGTDEDTPLVVQQWRNIIAVNYPARKFGITRMITAPEAQKLCPDLVLQHVPTWKEGETQWAYRPDAHNAMDRHKVSLEPYRIRSREILATLKDSLPSQSLCKIEKAGIDEVFLDLSAYVHDLLVNQLYPGLLADYREHRQEEPATCLPLPPLATADLDWAATGSDVIDTSAPKAKNGEGPAEEQDGSAMARSGSGSGERRCPQHDEEGDDHPRPPVDWDDVALLEGARVVRALRQALYDRLQFRCSAGIASNKMLSKLGSSQHKPNKQTVVRPRAAAQFLMSLSSVSKLRGLGGKMGARVVSAFDTASIAELLTVPLAQMQAKLGDQETGYHIYWMIRGMDTTEVTARTEIKSIISAKSFQPPLKSMDQALRWLRVFVAELKCRLVDEKLSLALLAAATVPPAADAASDGTEVHKASPRPPAGTPLPTASPAPPPGRALSNGGDKLPRSTPVSQQRQPQTIRLHYGSGSGHPWRSRQTRIPRDGTPLDENKLLRLGAQLLEQTQRADALWPCAHLAVSLDGFEAPVKGNKSIEAFFQPKSVLAMTTKNGHAGDADATRNVRDVGLGNDNDDNDDSIMHAGDVGGDHGLPLPKRRRTETPKHMPARHATPLSDAEGPVAGNEGGAEPRTAFDEQPAATSSSSSSSGTGGGGSGGHGGCGNSSSNTSGGASSSKRTDASRTEDECGLFRNLGKSNSAGSKDHNDNSNVYRRWERPPGRAEGGSFQCSRCSQSFPGAVQLQEHEDWHVARALQASQKIVLPPSSTRRKGHVAQARRTGQSLPPAAAQQTGAGAGAGASAAAAAAAAFPPISLFFSSRPKPSKAHGASPEGATAHSMDAASTAGQGQGQDHDQDLGVAADDKERRERNGEAATETAQSLACARCLAVFGRACDLQVHQDWHFAKDLEAG